MAKVMNEKTKRATVEKLFYQRCTGIQIPIMKLPALMKIGTDAIEAGKSEKEIGDLLYENAVKFGKEG